MKTTYKSIVKFLLIYILICIITCLSVGKFNLIIPYFITVIISSAISIFSYIVSKIYFDIQKNYIYRDLALIFGNIGILNLINLTYNAFHVNNIKNYPSNIYLIQLLLTIVIASLYFILIHKYKNKKFVKQSIILVNLFAIIIYILNLYTNLSGYLEKNNYLLILNLIIPICCILMYINNYLSISNMKRYLRSETIKDLKFIMIIKILQCIFHMLYLNIQVRFLIDLIFCCIIILNFLISYMIFILSIRDIVKKPNQNIFFRYQGEKNKLHKYIVELENKNQEILNYKNWVYESIMSVPEGMIICENEKIVFANEKVLKYLKLDNIKLIEGKNYEDIVISRNKNEKLNGLSINDIKIKCNDYEFIGQELNLESRDKFGRLNMIILKDIDLEKKLEELINKLEHKNKVDLSRNELLSNLSHEFKTPVNIIYSTAQLQEINFKKQDLTKEMEYNNLIKKNCNRLIRLINNFIDSTKFESNIVNTDLKLVNIVSLIEDLTESVINFAKNKNINVTFDTEEEEIYTLIDIEFMERILLNVLSNAIKYNKKDGEILVYIEDNDNKVDIKVKDTGIGIPKSKLDKLFCRFERFDNNSLSHEEGTGIGLNIVKQMVDALAGEINAESEENVGTTITITIPKSKNINLQKYDNYGDLSRRAELELSDIGC